MPTPALEPAAEKLYQTAIWVCPQPQCPPEKARVFRKWLVFHLVNLMIFDAMTGGDSMASHGQLPDRVGLLRNENLPAHWNSDLSWKLTEQVTDLVVTATCLGYVGMGAPALLMCTIS